MVWQGFKRNLKNLTSAHTTQLKGDCVRCWSSTHYPHHTVFPNIIGDISPSHANAILNVRTVCPATLSCIMWMVCPDTPQILFRNCFRNMTKSIRDTVYIWMCYEGFWSLQLKSWDENGLALNGCNRTMDRTEILRSWYQVPQETLTYPLSWQVRALLVAWPGTNTMSGRWF